MEIPWASFTSELGLLCTTGVFDEFWHTANKKELWEGMACDQSVPYEPDF